MKKWIRALVAGVVILAVILFGIFVLRNTQKDTKPKQNPEEQNTSVSENSTSNESTAENSTDDPDIIVKDNVKVITNEMKSEDQPTEVFEKDPGYQTGDVLVAGEISAAPSGFIRKVVQTEKTNQGYWVETEQATLLDVFEKAHIIKQFRLTEDGASETRNSSAYTIKRLSEDGQRKKTVITITAFPSMLKKNPFSFPERQDGDAGWNFRLISKTVKSSVELQ